MKQKYTVSCGTCTYRCVDNELQILLVKPRKGIYDAWGIPKGHLEKNESPEECAVRETKEETGVDVELEEELETIMSTVNRKEFKFVRMWFAKPKDTFGTTFVNMNDFEIRDAAWFPVNNLPFLHRYQQKLIMHAIAVIQQKLNSYPNEINVTA